MDSPKIPVEISNRHAHLSRRDIDALFGKGHELIKMKELFQPGEFASEDTITIAEGSRKIENVRVLGPERTETQVELSASDAGKLKKNVPVKDSGNIEGTPGIKLIGPDGEVEIKKGVIIARRHLHASEEEAKKLGLKDRQVVSIRIPGEREVIFGNVLVRVKKNYKLAAHLDRDEGNAAGIKDKAYCEIVDFHVGSKSRFARFCASCKTLYV